MRTKINTVTRYNKRVPGGQLTEGMPSLSPWSAVKQTNVATALVAFRVIHRRIVLGSVSRQIRAEKTRCRNGNTLRRQSGEQSTCACAWGQQRKVMSHERGGRRHTTRSSFLFRHIYMDCSALVGTICPLVDYTLVPRDFVNQSQPERVCM